MFGLTPEKDVFGPPAVAVLLKWGLHPSLRFATLYDPRGKEARGSSAEGREAVPMRLRRGVSSALAAALISALSVLAIGTGTGASTASSGNVPAGAVSRVTSTLDGMTTLPSRIRWVATPKPSSATITEVDYLIDGKVAWIEHIAPYVFGGDDNGMNRGYLVTTWLSPGTHRFTVRATDSAGTSVTATVTAKVHAAPPPPAALRGTWTRTVTPADFTRVPTENSNPTGQWELVFDNVGAWDLDPVGSGRIYEYAVKGETINVYAPIQEAPCSQTGACGISRYGHVSLGDVDCNASGPFGSYRWLVSANTLTLTPVKDGCPDREDVWAGHWTLSSPDPPPQ